jgi:hypothetical protein
MTTNPQSTRRLNHSAISLWASALVILALVIVQAGRMDPGGMAFADVADHGDMTMLNAEAGGGEDVVVILDRRAERIYVYQLVNRQPEMVVADNLSDLFARAASTANSGR